MIRELFLVIVSVGTFTMEGFPRMNNLARGLTTALERAKSHAQNAQNTARELQEIANKVKTKDGKRIMATFKEELSEQADFLGMHLSDSALRKAGLSVVATKISKKLSCHSVYSNATPTGMMFKVIETVVSEVYFYSKDGVSRK